MGKWEIEEGIVFGCLCLPAKHHFTLNEWGGVSFVFKSNKACVTAAGSTGAFLCKSLHLDLIDDRRLSGLLDESAVSS